jgi:hypothetical protein
MYFPCNDNMTIHLYTPIEFPVHDICAMLAHTDLNCEIGSKQF